MIFCTTLSPRLLRNKKMVCLKRGGSGQRGLWSIGQLTSMISGEGSDYGCILGWIHSLADLRGSRSGGVIGIHVYC